MGTIPLRRRGSGPAFPLPEKPAAAPGAHLARLTLLRGRPPLLPDQWNEADVRDILAAVLIFRNARDPDQFLDALIRADRDHQPAADLQLRLEGLRNLRPAGRHDDDIIGGGLQPPP